VGDRKVPHRRVLGHFLPVLLLFAACVVCYANGLTGNFTYDDKAIIRDDPRIRAPGAIGQIFTTPYFGGPRGHGTGYRPILLVSYAVQWWLHGGETLGFHAVNVALHALVTILFARLLRRLEFSVPISFGAAFLFAVHPIHVEAVTSLVGRGETLAAAFVIAFLSFSLRYRDRREHRVAAVALVLVCYALGVLSKESAAVAPALALLAFWRLEEGGVIERFRKAMRLGLPIYGGCAALLAATFLTRRVVLGGLIKAPAFRIFEPENPLAHLSTGERLSNAAAILFRYIGRLVLPLRLSGDESAWSIPVRHGFDPLGAAALLLGAALLVAAVARERKKRELAFGVLFFAVAFAATANLLFATGTIFAERVAYLPSAGFALALSAVVLGASRQGSSPSRRRAFLLFAIALGYAARTVARNPVWKDDETLFADTVRTSPQSAKAHYNFGWISAEKGRLPLALEHYTRATRIYPRYFDAWAGKGLVEQRLGKLAQAEQSFRMSLAVAPRYENGFFRLGVVREMRGNLLGAERAFSDGLAKNPKSAPLAFRLAKLRSRLARPTADADWRRAIDLARGAAPIRLGYAEWLFERGRVAEARGEAREVLRRRPRETAALALLADSSRDAGRYFSEGLAVEKTFRITRSEADFERLVRIAARNTGYRARFAAISPALERPRGFGGPHGPRPTNTPQSHRFGGLGGPQGPPPKDYPDTL
jgi:tetratricopeptide (TPR) repeat protein